MTEVNKSERLEDLQTLVSLCKRRGFIFPSSQIYGGLNACYDYGPLGVKLKQNIKKIWWRAMTCRRDIVGIDAAILMHPRVWEASGHVGGFSDPLIQCKDCKIRFRPEDNTENTKCPDCESTNLTPPKQFNLMFKTFMGAMEDSASQIYLRPETAQGIFVNFENVYVSMRKKVPFGIAQIGKAFRNEITPGNFIFRTREFEQMEMQYFVKPGTDEKYLEEWKNIRLKFYQHFDKDHIRLREHKPDELAHYAKAAFDIEYKFPIGWQEVEGIHNRTDFDLKQHQKFSGKNLEFFSEGSKEKFLPYVIETSVGCDRLVLMSLCDAYRQENISSVNQENDTRVVMKLHPLLSPVTVAVLPLSKKASLKEIAERLYEDIYKDFVLEDISVQYDETGSIGKRYRRQDEIGTTFCVTVDFDSLEDEKVTIRDRDSMKQERISISHLTSYIRDHLKIFSNKLS